MDAHSQTIFLESEGVEVIWAQNYKSRRRTQNRLAQRRYRERRRLEAQKAAGGSQADAASSPSEADTQDWSSNASRKGSTDCQTSIRSSLSEEPAPITDWAAISPHLVPSTSSPESVTSSYTVPPSSFLPPCSGPEVTPSNSIAQQISGHLRQLDTQAHDILAEMQRLHGLKANLDMLQFGQQFSDSSSLLSARYADMSAVYQAACPPVSNISAEPENPVRFSDFLTPEDFEAMQYLESKDKNNYGNTY